MGLPFSSLRDAAHPQQDGGVDEEQQAEQQPRGHARRQQLVEERVRVEGVGSVEPLEGLDAATGGERQRLTEAGEAVGEEAGAEQDGQAEGCAGDEPADGRGQTVVGRGVEGEHEEEGEREDAVEHVEHAHGHHELADGRVRPAGLGGVEAAVRGQAEARVQRALVAQVGEGELREGPEQQEAGGEGEQVEEDGEAAQMHAVLVEAAGGGAGGEEARVGSVAHVGRIVASEREKASE